MGAYITETWLRERFELEHGAEIDLPAGSRLTPSARGLLDERRIIVKYIDEEGRVSAAESPGRAETGSKRVNPLTGKSDRREACCQMCGQPVAKKPDAMTHLDETTLAAKNDPRLKLRGKLDTAIAQAVLLQEEFDPEGRFGVLAQWLADLRSGLGNALRAEVTGEPLPPVSMGGMDAAAIRAVSHNPLKYLGQDHLLPEVGHGARVARLNLLRALIREVELCAADVYIARDYTVTRPDIMEGLNRLSSAAYVLMLVTYLAERDGTIPANRIQA